jgi:hypothetical protein
VKPCDKICSHNIKCIKKCFDICIECREPCQFKCKHSKCSKECNQICDRKPCQERCNKIIKSCNCQCLGLCGERCVPCLTHDKKFKDWSDTITQTNYYDEEVEKKDQNERLYMLECGHVFFVDSMDLFFNNSNQEKGISRFKCPNCKKVLMNEPRYQNNIKLIEKDLKEIKKKYIDEYREYTDKEIFHIINKIENWDSTSVHWKKCPNGHLYGIGDCGGAMVKSKCPTCKSTIGGTNHVLESGNENYELDYLN